MKVQTHAGKKEIRNVMHGYTPENKLLFRREHRTKGVLKECWYTRDQLPDRDLEDGWPKGFVTKCLASFDARRKEKEV
jgi:hypothetical protein